jgi:hypothetical protein
MSNFKDYRNVALKHLTSTVKANSLGIYYYEISEKDLESAKQETESTLKSALAKNEISKDEFNAMFTSDKGPGKFYQLFKVHKEHNPNQLPPGRPIISGCNSITVNLCLLIIMPNIYFQKYQTPDLL